MNSMILANVNLILQIIESINFFNKYEVYRGSDFKTLTAVSISMSFLALSGEM